MEKVQLIRLDSPDHQKYVFCGKEIVIGRGSSLGCDDKRVSRNHGSLQRLDDGSFVLEAHNTNPCFYKAQDQDAYAILMKGQKKTLFIGDEFSLLPHSFCYQLAVKKEAMFRDENPVQNSSNTIEATGAIAESPIKMKRKLPQWLNDLPKSEDTQSTSTVKKRKKHQEEKLADANISNQNVSVSRIDNSGDQELDETRVEPHGSDDQEPDETRVEPHGSDNQEPDETRVEPHGSDYQEPDDTRVEPHGSDNQELDETRVEPHGSDYQEPDDTRVDVKPDIHVKCEADNENAQLKCATEPESDVQVKSENGSHTDDEEDIDQKTAPNNSTDQDQGPGSSTAAASRDRCIYGKDCFRKNPQHRMDYSHPGDADFAVNADVPECQYGTSCYRKNVQHRKDFKHTKRMPRAAAQATTTTRRRGQGDTSSEDDYDLDDSFLNDNSSDDYQPSESAASEADSADEDNGKHLHGRGS